MKSYISLFRNYANFSGFMRRGSYWSAMIIHWLILVLPLYPLGRFLVDSGYQLPSFYLPWVLPFWCFYFLLMIIPTWSATVRRLHTLPRSGWWLLLGLVPVVGWFIVLIWLLQKGNYETLLKRIKQESDTNNLAGLLHRRLQMAEKPRNGGWFFVVFVLLAVGGFFLNRKIISSGSQKVIMEAFSGFSSDGLASFRNTKKSGTSSVSDSAHMPVVLLDVVPGERVTSLKDGAELYLISDDVLAARYAVTYEQYMTCAADGACEVPALINTDAYAPIDKKLFSFLRKNGISHIGEYLSSLGEGRLDYVSALHLPMVDVTVQQAAAYCEWAGMRLPSLSEWQTAAGDLTLTAESGNCVGTDRQKFYRNQMQYEAQTALTIPVNAFEDKASGSGMVQMAGNIWEWVAPVKGESSVKALGGAWNSYPEEKAADLIYETGTDYSANNIGFRCFADASALTSDQFTDGKAAAVSGITGKTPVPAAAETLPVIEAEEIVTETLPVVEAEEIVTETLPAVETKADVTKTLPVIGVTAEPDAEDKPAAAENAVIEAVVEAEEPAIDESNVLPPEEFIPETVEPTDVPEPAAAEETLRADTGKPVIAKQDGSLLLMTENDVLASVYAVSVEQYELCVEEGSCEMPDALYQYAYPGLEGKANDLPMVFVTGEEAAAYCGWAGMRLPAFKEWQTAAAPAEGFTPTASTVNSVGTNRRRALRSVDQLALTVPVTSYRSRGSVYGMVQMLGNVWEWIAPEDGSDVGLAAGGAWNSYPETIGVGSQLETLPGYAADNIGFRCFVDADMLTPDLFEISDQDINELLNPGVRKTDDAQMAAIPGGTFTMGDSRGAIDEKPAHEVTLSDYWIDAYEVTNGQYALCVAEGACTEPHEVKSFRRSSYYGNPEFDNFPVIYVDWTQANAYCEWAGGRLPTEAEWEYAAKGPEGNAYPWGNTFVAANLNYSGSGNYDTLAVDDTPEDVSSFGVYNMGGNVSEWVADRYQENWYTVTNQPVDPTGPESGGYRVIRGSSAQVAENNARTVDRFYARETSFALDRGFRCVVSDSQ